MNFTSASVEVAKAIPLNVFKTGLLQIKSNIVCDRGEIMVYQKIMKLESDNKNEMLGWQADVAKQCGAYIWPKWHWVCLDRM